MKIERFLSWIQERLLNYPDINITTVKIFIDKFYDCLSVNEKKRWYVQIQMIREFTLKQLSIDETVHIVKTNNLENELNGIKERGK